VIFNKRRYRLEAWEKPTGSYNWDVWDASEGGPPVLSGRGSGGGSRSGSKQAFENVKREAEEALRRYLKHHEIEVSWNIGP
jgi:hypothetical protein